MKIKLLLLYVMFSFSVFSQIQLERTVLASSGTEISNSKMSISFTLGETFTSTFVNDKTFTEGFQQSDIIEASSPFCDSDDAQISIFPNPTSDKITFVSCLLLPFTYKIFDIVGDVVIQGYSSDNSIVINVSGLSNGKYIFEYILDSGQIQFIPFLKIP